MIQHDEIDIYDGLLKGIDYQNSYFVEECIYKEAVNHEKRCQREENGDSIRFKSHEEKNHEGRSQRG